MDHRRRFRRASCLAVGFGTFAGVAACGGDAPLLGPSPLTNCRVDEGILICVEKEEYVPFEQVRYSLSNGLSRVVFEDMCWAGIEGRRDPSSEWGSGAGSGVLRLCHPNQTFEHRLEAMVPIAPGEVRVDDGLPVIVRTDLPNRAEEWRLWVQILDAEGHPVRDEPFYSPVFRVPR